MLVKRNLGNGHYVEWDNSVEFVVVGDRLIPPRLQAVLPPWDDNIGLSLTIEVRNGAPVCRRLELMTTPSGRDLRASDLGINLDAVVEMMCAAVALQIVGDTDAQPHIVAGGNPQTPFWDETVRQMRQSRIGRPVRLTDERIRQAAEIYRANLDQRPTEAVAAAFGMAHRTAAKYVMEARVRGFLPPTTPGKKQA